MAVMFNMYDGLKKQKVLKTSVQRKFAVKGLLVGI